MGVKDVVIIGAGPAGIATAIQLKRYAIDHVIFEQAEVGGLLRNAHSVENYPGFPEGISGIDLVELFKKQLKSHDIEVTFEKVHELDYRDDEFITKTDKSVVTSKTVVIASGTKPRELSGVSISDGSKNQIFYEIYPIRDVANKKIAVIGAGDAAFDYALNLAQKNEVTILNRSEQVKCLPLLWERSMKTENISYLDNTNVEAIDNSSTMVLLECSNNNTNEKIQIAADYVLVAVGREPGLDFLSDKLKNSLEKLMQLNKLYMVGDVWNGIYRQTAISVGDGIKAAMQIYRTLEGDKNEN